MNREAQVELDSNDILVEKLNAFNNLIEVQSNCLSSSYQVGSYNGLILGRSVITGEEPIFYEQQIKEEQNG